MRKNEIKIGEFYKAKVSGNIVTVQIAGEHRSGGWRATNCETGKTVHIKTAARLREPAEEKAQQPGNKEKASAKPSAKATKAPAFHLFDEASKAFVPVADARPVKFKGFDDFAFFLHKPTTGTGWTISEASSGAKILTARTQKEAKEKATEALKTVGLKELAKRVAESVKKNGAAPGFERGEQNDGKDADAKVVEAKSRHQRFEVTTDDGTEVEVSYDKDFRHHLEFRGEISPTKYRSHFGYDGKGDVKKEAAKIANSLRAAFLAEQAKQARKAKRKKSSPADSIPASATRAKGKLSLIDAAYLVLKDATEPLCCKDITQQVFAKGLAESEGRTPHATLSAAMGREISKQGKESRFRRVDRGMYELNG